METDGRFCDEVEPLCSSAEFRQLCPGIAAGTEHPTKVAHEGFFLPSNLMGAFVEYLESACAYGNHSAPRGSLCLFDALASIQGFAVEEFFLSTYLQLHPSSRAGVRGRGWVCGPSIWAEHQRDLLGHLWPWLLQYCKSQSRILLVPWPKMSMSPYGGAPPARRPDAKGRNSHSVRPQSVRPPSVRMVLQRVDAACWILEGLSLQADFPSRRPAVLRGAPRVYSW